MHRFLVEEKKWIGENRFLHALNYCMLLPGPEAQQLATYIGWLLHGRRGGIVAGALFVLPGFLSILFLSILYALWKDVAIVEGIFYGIKPAVLAIVVGAVIKIGKKALKNEVMVAIAILSFIAIFFFEVAFPIIVVGAALIGFVGGKISEEKFYVIKGHKEAANSGEGLIDALITTDRPTLSQSLKTAIFWLLLWFVPIILLAIVLGLENIFTKESLFFSQAAVVTFGGAYSVLAYISQKAVETFGWLQPGEMLDGLGMAETTPGPLIQVVQFVGFMGAFRNPGTLDPVVAGVLASFLVTWVTFIPCFFFIFLGAPYIESLRNNKNLSTALSSITAAVVGVVLNLGIWFSLNTIFKTIEERSFYGMRLLIPDLASIDIGVAGITVAACVAYFGFKLDMLKTIGLCIALGLLVKFLIF
ncbi:Chromate transport protein ChrA [Fulvivirga imtechensis AK7]|uniref:Chromate transport protein ChrA n=1 Tax=Fulvivirga imtechensis AK7 TaxID=1237149 RepID=L8JYX2_9BACT|nr:chromate efflux transporter [Fulvivirga imtechensis]ELR73368.1 Chromate transport protein ChrA [Fulvivirga imtechensis AK7]